MTPTWFDEDRQRRGLHLDLHRIGTHVDLVDERAQDRAPLGVLGLT